MDDGYLDDLGFMADGISEDARSNIQRDLAEISQTLGFNPAPTRQEGIGINEAALRDDPFTQDSIPIVVLSKEHLDELRKQKKMAAYERKQRKEMKRRRQEWLLMQRRQRAESKLARRSSSSAAKLLSSARRSHRQRQQQQMWGGGGFDDNLGFRPFGYADDGGHVPFVERYRSVSNLPTSMPAEIKALGPRHPLYRQWKSYLQEVRRQRESVAHDGRAIVRSGRITAATPFVKDLGANAPTPKAMANGALRIVDMTLEEREQAYDTFKDVTTANRSCLVSTKDQCLAQRNRVLNNESPERGPCFWDDDLTFCFPTTATLKGRSAPLFQANPDSKTGADPDTPEMKQSRTLLLKEIKQNPTYLLKQLLGTYMFELSKYPYKNMLDQYVIIRANDCIANASRASGKRSTPQMELLQVLKSNVYMRTNMMMFCDGRREQGCIAACDFEPARIYGSGTCRVEGTKRLGMLDNIIESIKGSVAFVKKFVNKYLNLGLLFSSIACMFAAYSMYGGAGEDASGAFGMEGVDEEFVSNSTISFTYLNSMLAESDAATKATRLTMALEAAAGISAGGTETGKNNNNSVPEAAAAAAAGAAFNFPMGSAVAVIASIATMIFPFVDNLPLAVRPLIDFLQKYAARLLKLYSIWGTLTSFFPSVAATMSNATSGIGATVGAALSGITATLSGLASSAGAYLGMGATSLVSASAMYILPVLLSLAIVYFGYKFYKQLNGGDRIINAATALNTVSIAAQLNIDIERGNLNEGKEKGSKNRSKKSADTADADEGEASESDARDPELEERVEYPTMRAMAQRMNDILVKNGIDVSGLVEQYESNMRYEKKSNVLRESFESIGLLLDAQSMLSSSASEIRQKLQKTFNNGHLNADVNEKFTGFISEECSTAQVDTSKLNERLAAEMDD